MSILVLGSVNVDITAYGARLPLPGETVHAESYAIALGGKGANQAVAAARLGAEVALAGRTGADGFGRMARDWLAQAGVGTGQLWEDAEHPTGIATIGVARDGENAITVVGGANMAIGAEDVARLDPAFATAKVLLLQLEAPLAAGLAAAAKMRAAGGLTLLDPAPAPGAAFGAEVWTAVDAMTPNESETEALTGIRPTDQASAARAASVMTERGLRIAVVKMGAGGVYWKAPEGEGHVPAFAVKAIDTVAAGDCFNGGLGFALARGDGLPDALRFANACGALATTRRGASDAAPTLAEVEALLKAGQA
ncbi:ribokinase [Acidimangrovimonas pyrenivorans]|uniref:Ribokinase n=1 Tax=Acidimangrovimonas pyrenivorans TaxID=2030798 RepID=A0ABV7AJU2_9RHOB